MYNWQGPSSTKADQLRLNEFAVSCQYVAVESHLSPKTGARMDRRSSPITGLYEVAPEAEPRRQKSHTWLYVLLTIGGFFVFESITPVMHLRPDPPPSVLGSRNNQTASQSHMARACWGYAIGSVQKAYPFGTFLPKDPPAKLRRRTAHSADLSVLCWPKLRVAWTQQESWVRSYEWSTDWLTDSNGSFQIQLRNLLNYIGISL